MSIWGSARANTGKEKHNTGYNRKIEKEIEKIEKAVLNKNENKLNKLLSDFSAKIKELTRNEYYKTFIHPMNTLRMEILADNLTQIARR